MAKTAAGVIGARGVRSRYDAEVAEEILAIARRDRDAVVALLGADGMKLDVEFVAGPDEFAELLGADSTIFVGAFPGDDDGVNAVTVTLPDEDGKVRSHAY